MRNISLPHPPQSSLPPAPSAGARGDGALRRGGVMRMLDFDFIKRCAILTPVLGAILGLAIAVAFKSVFVGVSYFAGSVFGGFMLASLMLFVKRFAALKTGGSYQGADARVPLWALAVVKYFVFLVVAWGVAFCGWAQPFAFVLGVALMQLVIVARALGRKMTSRSIAEIYVDHAKQ